MAPPQLTDGKVIEGEGEGAMELVELEPLEVTSPQHMHLRRETLGRSAMRLRLETEEGSVSRETNCCVPSQPQRRRPKPSSRRLLSPAQGLCPSSFGSPPATNALDGLGPISLGGLAVAPAQTELFPMGWPLTTRAQLARESWSPRSPPAMTIQYGKILEMHPW